MRAWRPEKPPTSDTYQLRICLPLCVFVGGVSVFVVKGAVSAWCKGL